MTQAQREVKTILERFYYEHHDKIRMETELVEAVNRARLISFADTKHRVVRAIDHRIGTRQEGLEVAGIAPSIRSEWEIQLGELQTLRTYIKGMVAKSDG